MWASASPPRIAPELKDTSDVSKGAAILGQSVQVVATMATLYTITGNANRRIQINGYYADGDGGYGLFFWDAASSDTDNGGTIIKPTGVSGAGRWKRQYSGRVSVKWFGAKGDGVADDTTTMQAAIDVMGEGGHVYAPGGTYKTTAALVVNNGGHYAKAVVFSGDWLETVIAPVMSAGYAIEADGGAERQKVIFNGIMLDGSGTTGTASGILFNKCNNLSGANGLAVSAFANGAGLRFSECWTMDFYNTEVTGCQEGVYFKRDVAYTNTLDDVNLIRFFGGSLSANETCVKVGDGTESAHVYEGISFHGTNISGTLIGVESHWSQSLTLNACYFERGAGALTSYKHLSFDNDVMPAVNSPILSTGKNFVTAVDVSGLGVSGVISEATMNAAEILFDLTDTDICIDRIKVDGGSAGTFMKYTQTGTNKVKISVDTSTIGNFATLLNETIANGVYVKANVSRTGGLLPSDFDTAIRASGVSETGGISVGPSGNDIALLENSSTFGGTEQGWIQCYIGGIVGYIRVHATK